MKPTLYRLWRLSRLVALCFSLFWLPANVPTALAQQITPEQPPRSVSVSGSGQVNVRPDVAVIVVGVQTEAATASAALTQNSQQMIAVTAALTNTGILTDDIQTQVVQLQPHIAAPVAGQPQLAPPATTTNPLTNTITNTVATTSYIATNLVEVRVRDLTHLGQVLDSTIQAGGNQIQSIRFETSNPNQALDQARQAAWNDAKRKAEQLAQLAGVTLGNVLTLNEFSASPLASAQASAVSASAVAVPITPGAQTITVNVQVTWSLSE